MSSVFYIYHIYTNELSHNRGTYISQPVTEFSQVGHINQGIDEIFHSKVQFIRAFLMRKILDS